MHMLDEELLVWTIRSDLKLVLPRIDSGAVAIWHNLGGIFLLSDMKWMTQMSLRALEQEGSWNVLCCTSAGGHHQREALSRHGSGMPWDVGESLPGACAEMFLLEGGKFRTCFQTSLFAHAGGKDLLHSKQYQLECGEIMVRM